jgi:acyl-CoA oxidase
MNPAQSEQHAAFQSLWQNPALQSLAPLVMSAWEDGYLTPGDILTMREALERATWLDASARRALLVWLDPASPPTPQVFRTLQREVARMHKTRSREGGAAIGHLAESLAGPGLGGSAPQELAELLEATAPSAGGGRASAASARVANQVSAEDPELSQLCRRALDGEHAAARNFVRQLLEQPSFRSDFSLDMHAYREQVWAWCRELAAQGLGAKAFTAILDSQRESGEFLATFETLGFFDQSLFVKVGVQFGLFGYSLASLGTRKHHELLGRVGRCEVAGCFAMTERAHGSNVRDIQTTATYDSEQREFVIHTPGLSAGKEWIGNAALHAHLAVVFAQLVTNGESYGVHAFVVPVRKPDGTLEPGVRVEDCGEKMGLNGVDNGRLWFDHVRVPRDALLDRFGQVSESGEYVSKIPSANKRFFTMLGTLVGARIGVSGGALSASKVGLAIAIRYAEERRQFARAEGEEEVRLLDYLTHQRRLLPRLAAAYAFGFAQNDLLHCFSEVSRPDAQDGDAREVERLAAGIKAMSTFQSIDTLQECRESCGGQGYLTANRIDGLRTDTDVFATFEGDNTVLLQLVAKECLAAYARELRKKPLEAIARQVTDGIKDIVRENTATLAGDETILSLDTQARVFDYRERTLLSSLARRIKRRQGDGQSTQQAFDECQDHAIALGRAHVERFVAEAFQKRASLDPTLEKLCVLFGLWRIEADLGFFLENGYLSRSQARTVRKSINNLVGELRPHALALVDAFGIPAACLGPLADSKYLHRSGLAPEPA